MKLKDVQKLLDVGPVKSCLADRGDLEVASCHASDLISDLLTFRGPSPLLLTGLTNAQVIRTAEILDFVAICFVRGKEPQPETVRLAEDKGIPFFVTSLSMYESCGRLYANGLPSGAIKGASADCQTQK